MSYESMDHAAWVEAHNAAVRKYAGRNKKWQEVAKRTPEKLSEFQARVMDILGIVGGGIHNCSIAWNTVDWDYGFHGVSVVWRYPQFSTFDFNQLTKLVFLCHEARIRCAIDPAGPRQLRLSFWQRADSGDVSKWHPNLDEAVARFRLLMPAFHRIYYGSRADHFAMRSDLVVTADPAKYTEARE